MPDYRIREARAGDGPGVARLWIELGEHHVRLDPAHHQHPRRDGLVEWIEESNAAVAQRGGVTLVADAGDELLGFVSVALREAGRNAEWQVQRDQGMRRAWINAIAVLAAHRRRGVGGALLAAAETWARDHGAQAIGLDVAPANAEALGLYRGAGFDGTALVMEKPL